MKLPYIGRRLLQVAPTVSGVLLLTFILIHIAPGDPIQALASGNGDEDYYAFMRHKFGLDQPLINQLGTYVGNILRGDLGTSYITGQSVSTTIGERLGATLLLTGTAIIVSSIIGIGLAVVASLRSDGALDHATNAASLILYASPVFWIAQLVLLFLSLRLGWFPVQGMNSAGLDAGVLATVIDTAWHLALPAGVLAIQEVTVVARLMRSGIREELGQDYIRTARAKGASESQVVVRHALRSALLPVVTVIGNRIGNIFSGAMVVELIFGWPGLGQLILSSSQTRDTPVLLGIFLLVAFTVVLSNLITDLSYAWIDPRIRLK